MATSSATSFPVADLLEEPQLAQLYAYPASEQGATVRDVMEALDLAQGTAYTYVNRLVDAGVVEVTRDEQPRTYAAREVDLTVTAGEREYTITPALVDAVGRRETDDNIHTYIDHHGLPASPQHSPTPSLVNGEKSLID